MKRRWTYTVKAGPTPEWPSGIEFKIVVSAHDYRGAELQAAAIGRRFGILLKGPV